MITPGADLKIYVATRPVDFRKGHDGLAALVQQMFGLDPFSGAAFVFRAKRADRVKILVWDQTGLVLVHLSLIHIFLVDRYAGANQRTLRDCEDCRYQNGAGLS